MNQLQRILAIPVGMALDGYELARVHPDAPIAREPFSFLLKNSSEPPLFEQYSQLLDRRHLTSVFLNNGNPLNELIELELEYSPATGYLIVRSKLVELAGIAKDRLRVLWTLHLQTVKAEACSELRTVQNY